MFLLKFTHRIFWQDLLHYNRHLFKIDVRFFPWDVTVINRREFLGYNFNFLHFMLFGFCWFWSKIFRGKHNSLKLLFKTCSVGCVFVWKYTHSFLSLLSCWAWLTALAPEEIGCVSQTFEYSEAPSNGTETSTRVTWRDKQNNQKFEMWELRMLNLILDPQKTSSLHPFGEKDASLSEDVKGYISRVKVIRITSTS